MSKLNRDDLTLLLEIIGSSSLTDFTFAFEDNVPWSNFTVSYFVIENPWEALFFLCRNNPGSKQKEISLINCLYLNYICYPYIRRSRPATASLGPISSGLPHQHLLHNRKVVKVESLPILEILFPHPFKNIMGDWTANAWHHIVPPAVVDWKLLKTFVKNP